MTMEELEIQIQVLQKQLSTVVELMGVQFILEREERNRRYERVHGRDSPQYTRRLKLIDDVNELCEVLQASKDAFLNQQVVRQRGSETD